MSPPSGVFLCALVGVQVGPIPAHILAMYSKTLVHKSNDFRSNKQNTHPYK